MTCVLHLRHSLSSRTFLLFPVFILLEMPSPHNWIRNMARLGEIPVPVSSCSLFLWTEIISWQHISLSVEKKKAGKGNSSGWSAFWNSLRSGGCLLCTETASTSAFTVFAGTLLTLRGGRNSGQRLSPANGGWVPAVPQNGRCWEWAVLFFFHSCFHMQSRFSVAGVFQSTTFSELDSVFLVDRKIKTWLGRRLEGHLVVRSWNQYFSTFSRRVTVFVGSNKQSGSNALSLFFKSVP